MANSKIDTEKLPYLYDIDIRLKILQTIIRVCYDVQAIDQKKYILLQESLEEIGRMLGGWIKSLKPQKENPAI